MGTVKYAIIGIAALGVIYGIKTGFNHLVDSNYARGFQAATISEQEAAQERTNAALKRQTEIHDLELGRRQALANRQVEFIAKLNESRIDAERERETALKQLDATLADMPDDEWFYLSEPIPGDVIDGMRGVFNTETDTDSRNGND